jgi:hypothetical protein
MILSRAQYLNSIASLLPDNSTQEISPHDLRTSLIDLVDSVPNFFAGYELDSTNFATPEVRTTKAGALALDGMFLAGRSSQDNSAFGYASLRSNYDGSGNTAIGVYALSCNLYGDYNTAVGFQSHAGNTIGSGNTAVGTFALNNSKQGNFNIAIGYGAGHYIGPASNFTLSIGVSPIESDDLCDIGGDPVYSGEPPLLYGNLRRDQHKLGIGTNILHDFGMLQVSGAVSPSVSGQFDLGKSNFSWKSINELIHFSGGVVGVGGQPSGAPQGVTDGKMTVYGDLVPSETRRYALGHPDLMWDGYFNDVVISGQAFINDATYNNISECLYECKTLHLATSGFCDPDDQGFHNSAVCGFLSDQGLDGAGFEVHSSGADYRRDYRFIYKFPDPDILCLSAHDDAFSRSRWQSNISLEVTSGNAIFATRLISNNNARQMSVMHQSGCKGMFFDADQASGVRTIFGSLDDTTIGHKGLLDFNFIARSGTTIIDGHPSGLNCGITLCTPNSGVKVMHRMLSRTLSSGVVGFSIIYHDERDSSGELSCADLGYGPSGVVGSGGGGGGGFDPGGPGGGGGPIIPIEPEPEPP